MENNQTGFRPHTLCFVLRDNYLLLGLKQTSFGKGKLNGFGGKVEEGETLEEAAARELKEESGLTAGPLTYVGMNRFHHPTRPKWNQDVHIYLAREAEGNPVKTREMMPFWFPHRAVPYDNMWPSDRVWLPWALNGHYVAGEFKYDENEALEVLSFAHINPERL